MSDLSKTLRMYGADWCGDCIRSKRQLDDLGVHYEYVDLVQQPDAADQAQQISGRTNIPVVVFPDGSHLVEPSNPQMETRLRELGLI